MQDQVSILLIIIFILGCTIIYLWQHRGSVTDREVNRELLDAINSYRDSLVNNYYNDYIKELLKCKSEDLTEALDGWNKAVQMIDEHLPFFKTGYMATLVLGDTRYLDLVKDIPEDIDFVFIELERMLDNEDKDLERLADLTLLVLKWFRKKVVR